MDAQQARMFKKIKQGKAVLFLGAGTSCCAGTPLAVDLARMVHGEFLPGTPFASTDLIDVCSAVLDTPGVDRTAVEDFIRKKLDVQPSHAHRALCRNRWRAMFTTNFDDLVETAYRSTANRAQRCEPVFGRDFSRAQSDYVDLVRLFKLMGCVTGRDDESRMALTRSDYNRKLRHRGPLLKLLYDFVKDGTIVYIGYSFSDRIARDITDEVVDEVGMDRLPWGWALLPSWDAATEQLLRSRKILPLAISFEDFAATLCALPPEADDRTSTPSATVTVAGVPVEIPAEDHKMYLRQFYFLHDQTGLRQIADEVAAKRDFLEGKSGPWPGIVRGWAFPRPIIGQLKLELAKHLANPSERDVPIVLLTGPAASGKTTLALLAAYQTYRDGQVPCILLAPERDQVDYLMIDSFARQIAAAVDQERGVPTRFPILVVVDEATGRAADLRRLAQYMVSRGIAAVILAVARENEWRIVTQPDRHTTIRTAAEVIVPDTLSEEQDEAVALIRHLRSIGIFTSAQDDAYWKRCIALEYQNSFQTTLYYLAEPTRPPLSLSIKNEYDRLLGLAQEAYRYVCIFYQFEVPLDLELLARGLGRSYEEFLTSIYDPASIGVIIENDAEEGTSVIRYRARSRLVAERIVEYVYSDPFAWLVDLRKVISSLLPNNTNELETIRNVLIRKIGPRGVRPVRDVRVLAPLFEAAFAAGMQDSATLHHYGLLRLDAENFDAAQAVLLQALAVLDEPSALSHFKTESHQHLYNSLGMTAARYGLWLESFGREEEARKQFQRAVQYFRSARSGLFPNAYPYYCESWMLYSRAKNCSGELQVRLLANALQVLDEAEGNISDDERSTLEEMEGKVIGYMADVPSVDVWLDRLVCSGDPDGEYLKARMASKGSRGIDARSAYSIVERALERTPNHIACLRLASRLQRRVAPDDWEGWWKLLNRQYQLQGPAGGCGLLFNLAYASCQLARYDEAARYFEQLDAESTGHPKRSGIVERVMDGKAERRFTGTVKSVVSRWEAWLRSDVIGRDVKCTPVRQKFTITKGVPVSFSLALNYRGLLAVDLRPA